MYNCVISGGAHICTHTQTNTGSVVLVDHTCPSAPSSSCSVAVQRESVTVSMSAVTHYRTRFFSAEGELLYKHTHTNTVCC